MIWKKLQMKTERSTAEILAIDILVLPKSSMPLCEGYAA